MYTIGMDKKAIAILENWDPFNEGKKAYAHEIADVVLELHNLDDPTDLAKRIRAIYEHSHELWIPIENCVQVSYKLLAVKYEAKRIV
ncbi:DUF1871 family protein [Sporosarcina siberiensis]|uniref:DUF1871 family protein n=1 Tax=Sporosarcina siberiensis TaxID=1365606 RepID=A0ABW4SF40_9BACL